jgi:hypothetical protein
VVDFTSQSGVFGADRDLLEDESIAADARRLITDFTESL